MSKGHWTFGARAVVFAAIVGGAAAGVGGACYNPNIAPGGLRCAAGGAKPCPDGFMCQGGVCISEGSTGAGGAGAAGGIPATGGRPGSGGMTGSGGSGGMRPARQVGETCLLMQDQSHDCQPGLLCIEDCANARCYRPCTGDADCGEDASFCRTPSTPGGQRVCEWRFMMCTPTAVAGGGCVSGRACYLVSSLPATGGGDRTVCDCSIAQSGIGQPCSTSRDCFPGLLCPPPGNLGEGFCRRVCDPEAAAATCGATTCRAFGANWGYCFN